MARDRTREFLAYMVVGGWIAFILVTVAIAAILGKEHGLPDTQFGLIWSGWLAAVGVGTGYYFGSSQGSDRKTELLAEPSAPAAAPARVPWTDAERARLLGQAVPPIPAPTESKP